MFELGRFYLSIWSICHFSFFACTKWVPFLLPFAPHLHQYLKLDLLYSCHCYIHEIYNRGGTHLAWIRLISDSLREREPRFQYSKEIPKEDSTSRPSAQPPAPSEHVQSWTHSLLLLVIWFGIDLFALSTNQPRWRIALRPLVNIWRQSWWCRWCVNMDVHVIAGAAYLINAFDFMTAGPSVR